MKKYDLVTKRTILVVLIESVLAVFHAEFGGVLLAALCAVFPLAVLGIPVLMVLFPLLYGFTAAWSVIFAFMKIRRHKLISFVPLAMVVLTALYLWHARPIGFFDVLD
ncbi:hypothetical protein [Sporobacter termitidis]|uniref:hypothetical protein n=1 Tax=Sporobacter termitidis TaxID=44749 RepID=UPI0011604A30|nr:hypothetical protein [Sporobacter termitidis]